MRDNVSEPFDGPSAGRILTERNVGSNLIVIGRVFREDSPKVLSVEHQQMVRALAPGRADQAFDISVLPNGPCSRAWRPILFLTLSNYRRRLLQTTPWWADAFSERT